MDFFTWSRALEILGFSIGILYLWWEYHADRRLWLASIVMPTISGWIYFSKGLYADFAINIYYFLMAIYGFVVWSNGGSGKAKKKLPITRIDRRHRIGAAAVFALLWLGIFAGLKFLTDRTVPVADSFTTALSIVGTWMLARKYLEQWLAWVAVDAVCVFLYAYKGIYFYALLYAIYTVIAVIGYRKWGRMMQTGDGGVSE
ncbi:MAG: nicotinamide riboside transporter PnuC [Muribaculaceae bacterium]|nr:nicotinamide riboside transporter PnuC [Muribaculaceae bacterium]